MKRINIAIDDRTGLESISFLMILQMTIISTMKMNNLFQIVKISKL